MRTSPLKLKIIFFIWSFWSFLVAIWNIRFKSYHSIILLFSFIYGYSVYMHSGDILRYADSFHIIGRAGWSDYVYLLKQVFSDKEYVIGRFGVISNQPDFYALSMQFFISRFTDNPRWLFAFVSLIYAYLFLKFLNELISEIKWLNSPWQKVFFIYLLVVVPFYVGVTGIRFWTALFFFLIFAMRYVKTLKIKYILYAAAASLIHFTFIFPVLLLIFYRLINVSKLFSYCLIITSLVFYMLTTNEQILSYIQSMSSLIKNAIIESRIESYGNAKMLAQYTDRIAATNWYVRLTINALPFFLAVTFMLEFTGFLRWKSNEFLRKLYPFLIIFFVVTLLTFNLGSIGRFQYIFYLLSLSRYTILYGINPDSPSLKLISHLLIPVLILHITIVARAGFYTIDPLLLIGNPLVLFFIHSDISLSELLVGH